MRACVAVWVRVLNLMMGCWVHGARWLREPLAGATPPALQVPARPAKLPPKDGDSEWSLTVPASSLEEVTGGERGTPGRDAVCVQAHGHGLSAVARGAAPPTGDGDAACLHARPACSSAGLRGVVQDRNLPPPSHPHTTPWVCPGVTPETSVMNNQNSSCRPAPLRTLPSPLRAHASITPPTRSAS